MSETKAGWRQRFGQVVARAAAQGITVDALPEGAKVNEIKAAIVAVEAKLNPSTGSGEEEGKGKGEEKPKPAAPEVGEELRKQIDWILFLERRLNSCDRTNPENLSLDEAELEGYMAAERDAYQGKLVVQVNQNCPEIPTLLLQEVLRKQEVLVRLGGDPVNKGHTRKHICEKMLVGEVEQYRNDLNRVIEAKRQAARQHARKEKQDGAEPERKEELKPGIEPGRVEGNGSRAEQDVKFLENRLKKVAAMCGEALNGEVALDKLEQAVKDLCVKAAQAADVTKLQNEKLGFEEELKKARAEVEKSVGELKRLTADFSVQIGNATVGMVSQADHDRIVGERVTAARKEAVRGMVLQADVDRQIRRKTWQWSGISAAAAATMLGAVWLGTSWFSSPATTKVQSTATAGEDPILKQIQAMTK